MTIRPLAAALLALSALALAACGEDTPSAAGSADTQDKMRQAQLKFAECMRDHNIDMPDPSAEGGQDIKIGGDSGISPEAFERANQACEKYRKAFRRELTPEQQQEFRKSALAHSRCMREHGIDFPDPTFDAEGGASVRIHSGRKGIDPENDPKFQAADEACRHLLKKPAQNGSEK